MRTEEKAKRRGGGRNRVNQVIAGILVNSVYEMKNYPVVLVNTVLSPLSFLLLISFVSRGALIGEAILGGLIMSMFSAGTALQSDLSHLKNDFKLQDMLVSSPASPQLYVLGMTISEIIYTLPALAILIALAGIYIHPTPIQSIELVAALLLMFMTSVVLGFMLSTLSSDIVQSFAFSRIISTVFTTLPPVYYPITYIPVPVRYLAYLSPTTYGAELVQNATNYLSLTPGMVALNWGVLLGVTVVLTFVTVKKSRWRDV